MFILASASPRRMQLLKQSGYAPDKVIPPEIDETPRKGELPAAYASRMGREKAKSIAAHYPDAVVLAADTVVACGRRILPKANDENTARACLKLLSGRRHRVYTGMTVAAPGKLISKRVMTQVSFYPISAKEIEAYIASGEWRGKAGGYAIQGRAEAMIPWIRGSISNVVGLPMSETSRMLTAVAILAKDS